MGEAVLRHVAKERGIDLEVDSAGTAAYHTGEEPDERYVPMFENQNLSMAHTLLPLESRTVATCRKVSPLYLGIIY